MAEAGEHPQPRLQRGVGAGAAAPLYVPHVQDEGEVLGVDAFAQQGEAQAVRLAVRHVADRGELEAGSRHRRGAAQDEGNGNQEKGAHGILRRFRDRDPQRNGSFSQREQRRMRAAR